MCRQFNVYRSNLLCSLSNYQPRKRIQFSSLNSMVQIAQKTESVLWNLGKRKYCIQNLWEGGKTPLSFPRSYINFKLLKNRNLWRYDIQCLEGIWYFKEYLSCNLVTGDQFSLVLACTVFSISNGDMTVTGRFFCLNIQRKQISTFLKEINAKVTETTSKTRALSVEFVFKLQTQPQSDGSRLRWSHQK